MAVPCNMPAGGESVVFEVLAGESLKGALEKAIKSLSGLEYGKLEGLVDVGESCSVKLLSQNGNLTHACLDCDSGEYRGAEAISKLQEISGAEASRGYLEIIRLSSDAYQLDAQSDPESIVEPPVSLEDLIKPPGPSREETARDEAKHSYVEIRTEPKMVEARGTTPEELAILITDLIFYSKMVDTGKDIERLMKKAIELSQGDNESFYRLMIDLNDGRMINIFFYKGKPCSTVVVAPGGLRAEFSIEDPEEIVKNLSSETVRSSILYRVQCEQCRRIILGSCNNGREATPVVGEKPSEEKRKEVQRRERKRRGLLGFLFRGR